jgi:hypothetical protein
MKGVRDAVVEVGSAIISILDVLKGVEHAAGGGGAIDR